MYRLARYKNRQCGSAPTSPQQKVEIDQNQNKPSQAPFLIKLKFPCHQTMVSPAPTPRNPYLGRSNGSRNSKNRFSVDTTCQTTPTNMGCQSQKRNGAIQKCRKRGTRVKHRQTLVQRSIGGGEAFDPLKHCKICVATRLVNLRLRDSVPHRPHHIRCPLNTKTRGLSESAAWVSREIEQNIAKN